IDAFEGTLFEPVSKQVTARRGSLTDTNNNLADFVRIDYRTSGTTNDQVAQYRPRSVTNGAWDPFPSTGNGTVAGPASPFAGSLLIFQAGASANGAIQRSFVELYNNTNNPINLNTYSLQYGTTGTSWTVINLTGTIPARGSYLVVGDITADTTGTNSRLAIATADQTIPGFQLSNQGFKVALMANQHELTVVNPFVMTGGSAADYVDLLGTTNGTPADAFEAVISATISQQAAARRGSLADTNNNSVDFVRIDYRTADLDLNRPRSVTNGTWHPYPDSGEPIVDWSPDPLEGKILILQAYGGSNANAVTNHFVELYNITDTAVNLAGFSLQYAEGTGDWTVIPLTGSIPGKGSYLILGQRVNETGRIRITAGSGNVNNNMSLSNRSFRVALINDAAPLTVPNPFRVNSAGDKAKGYIDMVGARNASEQVAGYEGPAGATVFPRISAQEGIRRASLVDTNVNGNDFVSVRYTTVRTGEYPHGVNDDEIALYTPKNAAHGAWEPIPFVGPGADSNASISALLVAGQTANAGTPAATYDAVTVPGAVSINDLVAGSAAIQPTIAEGATFRTAKVTGSGAPVWNNSVAPSWSFADGDFLYIEVTSANGSVVYVYKIAVTVTNVSGTVAVSGTYTINRNSTIPLQQVSVEAHTSQGSTTPIASVNPNLAGNTWSLSVPSGETVWFKVMVTDNTGYTFGRMVSTSGQAYTSNTPNVTLTLGPFAAPELTAFTLIDADANAGNRRNKTGTINQGTGAISFANTSFTTVNVDTVIHFHRLAANFTVSSGSRLLVGNVEQENGVTTNNYYNAVTFTVVAEDNARKTYTIAGQVLEVNSSADGSNNATAVNRVVGTSSWQTQGFGVMMINTQNNMGIPSENMPLETRVTNKLNSGIWNDTGTYTYIGPTGRSFSGGTRIRNSGNWTYRFDGYKSYNLSLNVAAGFDYYDYKTEQYEPLPAHRRWRLLAHQGDPTRMRGALGWELGRRVLTNMGWQPHADWVFLFVNNQYKGMYILTEVIKPESERLDITPLVTSVPSGGKPNGGFVVEMNNSYFYFNEGGMVHNQWDWDNAQNQFTHNRYIFDAMYNFMTSHQNPTDGRIQGIIWSMSEPDENLGWYYADPPLGNGSNLDWSATFQNHFPRRAIVLQARLGTGADYNRRSAPTAQWTVANDPGSGNGMVGRSSFLLDGTLNGNNGGVAGTRTLESMYPGYASSTFVQVSQFIQETEDAIYARDWGTNGVGGYHDNLCVDSLIDWHIAHELFGDWEMITMNGRFMHYDPRAGKLKMGPIWDLDGAWGSRDDGGPHRGAGPGFLINTPFWLKELFGRELTSMAGGNLKSNRARPGAPQDTYYINRFKSRWNEVSSQFNAELDPFIDATNRRFNRVVGFSQATPPMLNYWTPHYTHNDTVRINGDRAALKTTISTMRNNLNPIFNGY
ncbi:MAG: CotH kinase family protein, partial [Treponema sp.]|nr:CotH kinase family protein [Treponema sp.]